MLADRGYDSDALRAKIAGIGALANIRPVDHLQKLVIFSTTNTGCAFLMPLLMLAYWRRANGTGATAAMCAGVLTVIGLYGAGVVIDGGWSHQSYPYGLKHALRPEQFP